MVVPPPAEVSMDIGDGNLDEALFQPLQRTIDQTRSAKVAVK
jgi:hypothetical protein